MAKIMTTTALALLFGLGIASVAQAAGPMMITGGGAGPRPAPAPVARPTYVPPSAPVVRPAPAPVVRPAPPPIPKPNFDYLKPPKETNEVKLPPPPPPPPPPRFEGGGMVAPTPGGGGAGGFVVQDNKRGVTVQGSGHVEQNGAIRDSNVTITAPMPGGEPKKTP